MSEPTRDEARPPGVSVDLRNELPAAAPESPAERGLATVSAPLSHEAARRSVRGFFEAVAAESVAELEYIVDGRAWLRSDASGSRQRARSFWRTRFARLDYSRVAPEAVYRERDVEMYTSDELATLAPERGIDVQPSPGDLVVRVPIVGGRDRQNRLFGEQMLLVLRHDGERFRIVELFEDFRLP